MSNINLTCDVCGREVMGYTWNNGMRFCAKCYQETFGNTLTTQQLLDFIKNSGWDIGGRSNVERLDKESHNMELQQKVKVLEKALELACEEIFLRTFPYLTKEDNPDHSFQILAEHFKTEAKKIIESKKMGVDPEELPDFD